MASAVLNGNLWDIAGMANSMTNQLTNSNAFTKTDLAGAVANAENGGLSLLGYSNPNGQDT